MARVSGNDDGPLRMIEGREDIRGTRREVLSCGHYHYPLTFYLQNPEHDPASFRRCPKCKADLPPDVGPESEDDVDTDLDPSEEGGGQEDG
jgi:hypothetical protein